MFVDVLVLIMMVSMNRRMMNVLATNLLNELLRVVLTMNLLEIMFDNLLLVVMVMIELE